MKALVEIIPTSEQLPIISNPTAGITIIRGAAGSGKTSTALLMLKQLSQFWKRHRERVGNIESVKILVLTFNRTLKGYISFLAKKQITNTENFEMEILTFGKWAINLTGCTNIISQYDKDSTILRFAFGSGFRFDTDFLCDEVTYCVGRYLREDLENYVDSKREGRGKSPRLEKPNRIKLLEDVIKPFEELKNNRNLKDWNDLAIDLINDPSKKIYDIIIVDESQDFSANEMRAIMKHANKNSTVVFVLDVAQKIYPRGWIWKEIGVDASKAKIFSLKENHRNTIEICALASPLLEGLELSDDGFIPNLKNCKKHGDLPRILSGTYSLQVDYIISYIKRTIDLKSESIVFAHPQGGKWFDHLRKQLELNNLEYVELTREDEWPNNDINIALITMNSAKGLEFDHVIILGLNADNTKHEQNESDTKLENLRRLLAMTITRARATVTLGYKAGEESSLFHYFKSGTFERITL
jgi:DNA helicase IV